MIRIPAVFAACLLANCALAQSQPKPVPESTDPTQNAQANQAQTQELRAIASELRSIRDEITHWRQQQADQEARQDEPLWSNWALAVVALTAAFVAYRTLQPIRQQAENTAKHLALTESGQRARVAMSHHPPGLRVERFEWASSDRPVQSKRIQVSIRTQNFGKTSATVTAQACREYWTDQPLPKDPPYSGIETFVVPQHPSDFYNRTYTWFASVADWNRLRADSKWKLYVLGYVDFITETGVRRRAGYAREYDPGADDRDKLYVTVGDSVEAVAPFAHNNLTIVGQRA